MQPPQGEIQPFALRFGDGRGLKARSEERCFMGSYCEVFQRVEKKYRLNGAQRAALQETLSERMRPDAFGRTRIVSLYLDTPHCELIGRSLEKPLYKEKIRLRAYGLARGAGVAAGQPVFFEIKKKCRGVVYKRRVGMSAAAACAFFEGLPYEEACSLFPLADARLQEESLGARSVQISREIEAMLSRCGALAPSFVVACERTAWKAESAEDVGLRVTFDECLEACDVRGLPLDDLLLGGFAPDASWRSLVPAQEGVMELKHAGSLPLWLAHALAECGAAPISFSKCGTAYCLMGLEERVSHA